MSTTRTRLLPLSGSSDRASFAEMFSSTQAALRGDPYRVGLMPAAVTKRIFDWQLPFPAEFWILEDPRGTVLGRVAANVSPVHTGAGFLGFFEAADSPSAHQLISAALDWLRANAVKEAFGPVNFNTWFPYRFRIQSSAADPTPLFQFEPVNPPEYPVWFEQGGFTTVETYHSVALGGLSGLLEGTRADYERAVASGFSFRNFDTDALLDREVPILHRLSMTCFATNFLFERIPLEWFRELYVPLAKKADLSLAHFALDPSGREIGFFFNFVEQDFFVMKTTALLSEARGKGVSNAMLHIAVQAAAARGIKQSVAALIRDGIQSESYTRKEARLWRHNYALFRKELT